MSAAPPLIALLGNPNVGKTALFNRLTGQSARVGNYPGVTVERRTGRCRIPGGPEIELLDIPGTYSLAARSAEEQVAIDSLLGLRGNPRPALVLVVLDATQLGRNLYLALQAAELGLPTLLCLNLIDEAGDPAPDPRSVGEVYGLPCVATSARSGQGIPELRRAIAADLAAPPRSALSVPYPPALLADLARIEAALPEDWRARGPAQARALALWALSSADNRDELVDLPPQLCDAALACFREAEQAGRDLDLEVVGTRYALLDAAHARFYQPPPPRTATEKLDRLLLHPVAGFLAFLAIMLVVFQALFVGADPFIGLIEGGVGWVSEALSSALPPHLLTELLVDGVVGGVGNVIVFLPQILLLFFFIGLLEDSGYMARAAYLMDRIMKALGLHGRAFVPMLSGFACAVPAIMATRTMERRRDRLLTMLVVPLMTCSARLPVYTLIIGALFPPERLGGLLPVQGLLMVAMYVFSVLVALAAAGLLGRTLLRGPRVPLLLELPPYRLPTPGSILPLMWERSRLFLSEAGTVILACTVVMWGLLRFPELPPPADLEGRPPAEQSAYEAARLEFSYAGRLGKAIEPAIAPLGFDWKIGVGLIGSFAAREVFVSTMGVVYGLGELDDEATPLRDQLRTDLRPDGTRRYTPLVGLSIMVFFALAAQCMSTLAIVKRETRGYAWPAFLFAYMTALAWLCSFLVYQGGRLLGFQG